MWKNYELWILVDLREKCFTIFIQNSRWDQFFSMRFCWVLRFQLSARYVFPSVSNFWTKLASKMSLWNGVFFFKNWSTVSIQVKILSKTFLTYFTFECFFPTWTANLCFSGEPFKNGFDHNLHLNGFFLSWTDTMCFCTSPFRELL